MVFAALPLGIVIGGKGAKKESAQILNAGPKKTVIRYDCNV